MQGVVSADVVAVHVRAEQPVDVGGREAEVGERGDQIGLRLQVRRVDQDVLFAAHEEDARPDGTERDLQEERARQDLLERGAFPEDLPRGEVEVVAVGEGGVGAFADEDARAGRHEDVVPDAGADVVVFERLHRDALGLGADEERRLARDQDEGLVRGVVALQRGEVPLVEALGVVERRERPLRVVHDAAIALAAGFEDVQSVHGFADSVRGTRHPNVSCHAFDSLVRMRRFKGGVYHADERPSITGNKVVS